MVGVKLRIICLCSTLLALSAAIGLAAGNYQRTKDGKVIVWNGDPRPGDAAQWFGGRDGDGYAAGIGTLVWYTGKGEVYASYHGKMVRGKLDGPIDSRSAGKLAHAVFVNGERTTRWAAGSAAKAALASAQTISPAPKTPPENQASPSTPSSGGSADENNGTAAAKPDAIATLPATAQPPPTAIPERQTVATTEKKEQQTPRAAAETSHAADADQPAPSDSRTGRTAKVEADHQTPNTEHHSESDIPAEGPKTKTEKPTNDAFSIEPKPLPQPTRPTITIQGKPEVADFSGPPAVLRENSVSDTPAINATEPETLSSPRATQLAPEEAMELADAEASAHGYNPGEYERPSADYSAVKRQWSFLYNASSSAPIDKPQHFVVTVDEATKNAELKQ
jgi:hypothetical protein